MSKKNKSVFNQMTEALEQAITELQTTNTYLYGIGAELAEIAENLKTLGTQADKLSKLQTSIESILETIGETSVMQVTKPAEAETTTLVFKPKEESK